MPSHFNHTPHGFAMTFANECTISVQWGPDHYCGKRGNSNPGPSRTAEVCAWNGDGQGIELEDGRDLIGWKSPEEVLALMQKVAAIQRFVPIDEDADPDTQLCDPDGAQREAALDRQASSRYKD